MARKAIGPRIRFEVFKRDGFRCVYCGAHPPEVLLHCDHVVPVAEGGGADMENLVTACAACNLGKGARSLLLAPPTLAEKAAQLTEAEEQLRGYQEVAAARRERIEDEMWTVAGALVPGSSSDGLRRDWLQSIKTFLEKLGYDSVLDAAEIARARYPWGNRRTFLYFCGVCWRRVRGD